MSLSNIYINHYCLFVIAVAGCGSSTRGSCGIARLLNGVVSKRGGATLYFVSLFKLPFVFFLHIILRNINNNVMVNDQKHCI